MKHILIYATIIVDITNIYYGCEYKSCKNKVRNKYSFLDGHVDIQTVKQSKNESINLIKEICELTNDNYFGEYEKTLKKNLINRDNSVPFYINFSTINYILELLKNFTTKIKKTHKDDQKIKSLMLFSSSLFSKVFIAIVKKGEETDSNDLIIPIRNKTNELFGETLDLKDSLTGWIK